MKWARPSFTWVPVLLAVLLAAAASAADEVIPHAQDRPPGPPLSPQEAIRKMRVPEGFTVELVASEPDIVNPVAMTFDERGRIWITESLEYPRQDAGPGRDRIKILEDTNGDGKADAFRVFAEGLNIPSGIAVGHGGVWVANSPDILFLEDTDGDDRADKQEVVVTGFGRYDTHELPNSLTWGPDGWLYGLNGVFNAAEVRQDDRQYNFTCALFRIHPRTRRFELFCEGTSNPWGVAWDAEGSAFVSACVIDHLWHLAETGEYIRQGGPPRPFSAINGSIVKHKHQKAAYCGIHYFDSDAYPEKYRGRLFMGNIHGNCINVDRLERAGSTYFGQGEDDFLSANDAWFMPVVQKTGPDGCLYILDWYDRYHCYQDANRDPAGIDRAKGRLYRVRYREAPRAGPFNLAKESSDKLIARLASPNVFYRDMAQRLLSERNDLAARPKLERLVLDGKSDHRARMHALWALVGTGSLDAKFHEKLLVHEDASLRAWGVRAAGNFGEATAAKLKTRILTAMLADESSDVRLQVVIAGPKLAGGDAVAALINVLVKSENDPLIPNIVWQNLHPLMEDHAQAVLDELAKHDVARTPALAAIAPRVIDRILGRRNRDPGPVVGLVTLLARSGQSDPVAIQKCLAMLASRIQSRELSSEQLAELKPRLAAVVEPLVGQIGKHPAAVDAAILAATWRNEQASDIVRRIATSGDETPARRVQAIDALVAARDPSLQRTIGGLLENPAASPPELRAGAIGSLGRLDDEWVGRVVLAHYGQLEVELQPKAVELLTQRVAWAVALVDAIGAGKVPSSALGANHARKLLALKDERLAEKVRAGWGTLREDRNPQREEVIAQMRELIRKTPGEPIAGREVFRKVCGQCHKIYGEGQEVGPDISSNGRGSFEQLLSNVFDPSLVIGAAYQASTVVTNDGRVITGLVAEENDQRIVLKTQGGKLETIAKSDVDELVIGKLSLMPEDLEKQLKPDEIANLFAFLVLDRPPEDPLARRLAGSRELVPQETTDPTRFADLLDALAPGFSTKAVGLGGMAIEAEHRGRTGVLRVHPVDRDQPCVLSSRLAVPEGRRTRLALAVSHHAEGDWRLIVKAAGKTVADTVVGPDTAPDGWLELSVDLSAWAGKTIDVMVENHATGWYYELGYFGRLEVVSE